jgi:hypothetical protein
MAILGFQVNHYRNKWLAARKSAMEEEVKAGEREAKLVTDSIYREKELVELLRDSGREVREELGGVLESLRPVGVHMNKALRELRRLIRMNKKNNEMLRVMLDRMKNSKDVAAQVWWLSRFGNHCLIKDKETLIIFRA